MFFNNFINNIVKSMMALCVVANGWSDGGGIVSSNAQDLGDSPIMVNNPLNAAQPPVKRVLGKDSQSQNNTKRHKTASGTREEIKTSACIKDLNEDMSDYIKHLDMNIFTLKPNEIIGTLEQVQTWQKLLKPSGDHKELLESKKLLVKIATNLIAPISIKLDHIGDTELLNIIHGALMDYIDFDLFRSSLNLSCYTKNLDDELNKKAIKRELNKISNSECLLNTPITEDRFFSLIYELKNCKGYLTEPIKKQLINRAIALSKSGDQNIDKAIPLSASDDQNIDKAINFILTKIRDLYT